MTLNLICSIDNSQFTTTPKAALITHNQCIYDTYTTNVKSYSKVYVYTLNNSRLSSI